MTLPTSAWRYIRAASPYLLAAALFAFGLFALYKLLAPVNFQDVAEQVRATPWNTLVLAMLATCAAYLALVGYDWSALRYIGKALPLPVVLTRGLVAYAFGNTIGLSAVSGGAVRWRVYSGLGLDGYDVAAVSTFAAVSFGVAATLVGLGALAFHPGALAAVMPLTPGTLRVVALGSIAAIVAPLVWASLSRRTLTLGPFTLHAAIAADPWWTGHIQPLRHRFFGADTVCPSSCKRSWLFHLPCGLCGSHHGGDHQSRSRRHRRF